MSRTVEYNQRGTRTSRAVCQCTEGHVPRDNIRPADIRRPSDCVKAKGTLSTTFYSAAHMSRLVNSSALQS